MVLMWVKDRVKYSLRPDTADDFWALMECIRVARLDRECDPVLQLAYDELDSLQRRLNFLERVAFLSTLEQATTAD